jgi:uncharacterized membrane protein
MSYVSHVAVPRVLSFSVLHFSTVRAVILLFFDSGKIASSLALAPRFLACVIAYYYVTILSTQEQKCAGHSARQSVT